MATSKVLRRIGKGVLYFGAGLVLLVGLVIGFLHTKMGEERLRKRIEGRVEERVTTRAKLESLSFSLFSGIRLGKLAIQGNDGTDAITVGSLEIIPNWRAILRGNPTLQRLSIDSVRVSVRGKEDGTTNLTGVFRERKSIEHLIIEKLAVTDVAFLSEKADGTRISVDGVRVDADADIRPTVKTFGVALGLSVENIRVEKPSLLLEGHAFSTRARVAMVEGKGPISLGPTRGELLLRRDGKPDYPFAIDIPSLETTLGVGELKVIAEALHVAALSFASLRVETHREGAELSGEQRARAERLVVDAAAVNTLLGKRVLTGDLGIEANLQGPANAVRVDATITTPGGALGLVGSVDATTKVVDLSLATEGLHVNQIVALETVPKAEIGELSIRVQGATTGPNLLAVLKAKRIVVRDLELERVELRARYDGNTVTVEKLQLLGLGQDIQLSGTFAPKEKNIALDLKTEGSIFHTLSALKKAGIKTPTSPLIHGLALHKPLDVRVQGRLDQGLDLEVREATLGVLGGSIRATGNVALVAGDPAKGEKRFRADHVDVALDLHGVSLDAIGRLRGRNLPARGTVFGHVKLSGPLSAPDGDIDLKARIGDGEASSRGTLGVHAKLRGGALTARADLGRDDGVGILHATVLAHIGKGGAQVHAPLALKLDMDKRPLSDLGALLKAEVREKLPQATVELHADVRGSLAHPNGAIQAMVDGALLRDRLTGNQHAALDLKLTPSSRGFTGHVDARVALREGLAPVVVAGGIDVDGPVTGAKTAPLRYDLAVKIPDTAIDDLPLADERKAALATTHGRFHGDVHAIGTRDDLSADAAFVLSDFSRDGIRGLDASVAMHVQDAATTASMDVAYRGTPALEARATVGLAGKGLFSHIREVKGRGESLDAPLQATFTVPRTPLDKFVKAPVGGVVGGTISVAGRLRTPTLSGGIALEEIAALDGAPTRASIDLRGGLEALSLDARLADALTLHADTSPRAFLDAKKTDSGADVPVTATLTSKPTSLRRLLPNLGTLADLALTGTLDANLTANARLHVDKESRALSSIDLRGPLAVREASVRIPHSSRTFKDVGLVLLGDGDSLRIDRLELHEKDLDKSDRSLIARGRYTVPTRKAEVHAALTDMLVFGGNFGKADAPRGALSGALDVKADLGSATRKVDVTIENLELTNPDRFLRSHHQEVLSLGDVVELSQEGAPAIGKLARAEPRSPAPVRGNKTLEVNVHIPNLIHVKQRPLNLFARGDITIARFGDVRELSGKLTCEKGDLLVGGLVHTLDRGEIRMGPEGAYLDLHFHRDPHPAALRDFAGAEEATLYAHMVGPFGKQKLSFSGVADGLFEGLATNAGRTRVLTSPDAPASQTAQLPQVREIRQTAFMAANLPHLAFLSRMNTLASPSEDRFSYGRFQLLEAERYDGMRRLRVTRRPPVIGQSEAEVEYDLLFQNTPRVVSGVGLAGGTRAGGGPTLFWEWSSAE